MTQIYSIEGNIGSGKSTLVKILKQYFKKNKSSQIIFADEPVKEWMSVVDSSGDDILSKFYRDQHKYGFSFQMMAYISRISVLRKLVKDNPNSIIFTERSVYTDKNVFAQMLHDEGKINEIDFIIYNKWFNHFLEEIDITGIIYIQTNPEKCAERIIKRNRKGEIIGLNYLKLCHKYHENWLNNFTNVLTFDGNYDLDENIESYTNMINNIVSNIN
tara:strand:- start:2405 stop:3052 length:648 start_codon:yes stop_codon:yes gene_type:complete